MNHSNKKTPEGVYLQTKMRRDKIFVVSQGYSPPSLNGKEVIIMTTYEKVGIAFLAGNMLVDLASFVLELVKYINP